MKLLAWYYDLINCRDSVQIAFVSDCVHYETAKNRAQKSVAVNEYQVGCAYTIGLLAFLDQRANHSVLERRHQVFVTKKPSSDKYLLLEIRVRFVKKLARVDELADCFEYIRMHISKKNLALTSFTARAIEAIAEIVRVEDELHPDIQATRWA